MGAGLRTRTQRRRYESCRGSFGASGARRCQHETGCNALREAMPARALVCGSVRRGVRRSGGGGCARRRHAFAELWVGSGRLSGDSREGSRNGSTAVICTLSSILQQAYPHSRRAWAKPRRAWGSTMGTGVSPRGTRRRPPLPCSRGSGTGPALTGVIDQGRSSKAGC